MKRYKIKFSGTGEFIIISPRILLSLIALGIEDGFTVSEHDVADAEDDVQA